MSNCGARVTDISAPEPLRKNQRLRILTAAALVAALLSLSACKGTQHTMDAAPVTADDLVRKYLVLVVELGERDPDSLDFYVGSEAAVDVSRSHPEKLASLHSRAMALSSEVRGLPESSPFDAKRKSSLIHQVDAIAFRSAQLLGSDRSFDQESEVLFRVTNPADGDAGKRKIIRSRLAALLGKSANLSRAYSRYDSQFMVPAKLVPNVMSAALEHCRKVTAQHVGLPAGEHVNVEYVSHKPWSAFSHYLGNAHSVIEVNMDYPMTVDRLLNLACHEGYPGHHVFNSMRDQAVVNGLQRGEFLAQPTFSPQSYVSEAAASYAPSLALSKAERLHIECGVLFPLAALKSDECKKYIEVKQLILELHTAEPSIAREYLDGRLEFARAAEKLERETLMEHGEVLLLYLNEYRTYMLTYTLGRDSVRSLIEAGQPTEDERWRRYLNLMTNPVVSLPLPAN